VDGWPEIPVPPKAIEGLTWAALSPDGRLMASLSGAADVYWYSRMSVDSSTVLAVAEKAALLWRAPSWAEIEAAEKEQKAP
jgi:hypothetical protein